MFEVSIKFHEFFVLLKCLHDVIVSDFKFSDRTIGFNLMSNVSLLPSEILVSVLIDVKGLGVVVIGSKVVLIIYVDIADGNKICRCINKFNDGERLHVFVGDNDFRVLYIWDEFKSDRCKKHMVGERNLDSIFN